MIEFVTLLLGLVAGPRTVEVSVGEEVRSVEVMLDGESAGLAVREPWFVDCDFGEELTPHELVAVAYDGEGEELGRARQWINLPHARSQARLTLERSKGGEATARLIWTALDRQDPASVRLTFDGQHLAADDFDAIAVPPHDPRSLHFLRAELKFSESVQDYVELVFGGTYGDTVSTELTAVVLAADGRPPKPEKMAGWLSKQGRPLTVVAVEQGPLNLLVVRELSAGTLDGLGKIFSQYEHQRSSSRVPPVQVEVLSQGDRVRFVYPTAGGDSLMVGRGAVKVGIEQVPVSRDASGFGPLFNILTHGFSDEDVPMERHQLADAVAIGGMVAATGDQRRAVILMRSGEAADNSRFDEATVKGYLSRLRVPLFVFEVPAEEGTPSAWGESWRIGELRAMNRALDALRKALRPQIVVWVEGAHLTHEIELTAKAKGLRPVGRE